MKIELSAKQVDALISDVETSATQLEKSAVELEAAEWLGLAAHYRNMANFRFDIAATLKASRARKGKTT